MIRLCSSVSIIYTILAVFDDDTLPGPYDPSECDLVFATWFDFCPVVGLLSKDAPSLRSHYGTRALTEQTLQTPASLVCIVLFSGCNYSF